MGVAAKKINNRHRGNVQDISERRQEKAALKESEEMFRRFVETSPDLLFQVNRTGRIEYVSPRVTKMYGYEPHELIGRHLRTTTPTQEFPKALKALKKVLSGNPLKNFELNQRDKAGRIIPVEINVVPIYNEGKIVGAQGVMRNITERKRAERELQRSYHQLRETLIATVNTLASAIEMRDPYTAGHQRRVTILACAIAEEMDLTENQFDGLHMAGLIHDLGKISVPAEILDKAGSLSETEFDIIKTHPQTGYNLLKEIEFPWPVAQVVLQHHERLDGSGYPRGLKGEEIMLEARILAVADVVEAMVSHRPYRAALGIEAALEEISKNKGILYDQEVVDACIKLFTEKEFKFEQV
jgi:PAS domain S-box-containing protein